MNENKKIEFHPSTPLAEPMRPVLLDDFFGQKHLVSGEDPLYIARRRIRFASEDVAISCRRAYDMSGSSEGKLSSYHAVAHLATVPKSNILYLTEKRIKEEICCSGALTVYLHLRNAPNGPDEKNRAQEQRKKKTKKRDNPTKERLVLRM